MTVVDAAREKALEDYRKKLLEHKEVESRLKEVRESLKELTKQFDKSENDLKALQSVGQIVGEVLKQLTEDKFIVKATNGPRYVVGCRRQLDKTKLKSGTRVALDMTTLTIMRYLPREVDPLVYNMSHEDPGEVTYSAIGGLSEQIRELREVIELPLLNPELFLRVGITPPKGCLLYGPPGTGKTLLARAVASQLDANFLKVVSSAIVDKYIGESARLIREMFNYARDHQPCIIFMDEIDAIGGRRFSEGTSADREIQRTLMELLNQMDGFDSLGQVKMIMATNRPDTLDPALLRPGRLDRKIEIPLPNEQARLEILKIHAAPIAKHGDIDYEAVVKLSDNFNGADLRNVCTEAGLFAIRAEREYVIQEDFMKAVRKVADNKRLESKLDYKPNTPREHAEIAMGLFKKCCVLIGLGSVAYFVRWYYIGRLYESKRKFQNGEVIVLTGANSGIGLATLTELAGRGCHLVIGTRSVTVGQDIRDKLLHQHPVATVDVFELKLESLASVAEFSENVRNLGKPLYALINNAGVFYAPPSLTDDKLEYLYQVNYLAHFLLTLRLLPALKQHPADSRIVNVVSQAHRSVTEVSTDDSFLGALFQDTPSNRFRAYQYSKFCLVQFSYRLSQLLAVGSSNIPSVHCIDPGNVETAIYRHFPPLANRLFFYLQKPLRVLLVKTPHEGAQALLYAVLSEQKPPFYVRRFWGERASDFDEINPLVRKEPLADSLWKRSRQQCSHHLLEMMF
uniref:AAA+ ATPase domain-containing protein n=1 Tax=Anopheles dirus TaxID=7168 RepID=A0A182N5E1_9DIPT